jgi:circadian clock protein KaiB
VRVRPEEIAVAKAPVDKTAQFERALAEAGAQTYVLRLCISGMTPRSRDAIVNLKHVCDTFLPGHYELEVIDLYQQPEMAAEHQILATPTLVKCSPLPARRMVGDLSDTGATLRRLGIASDEDAK